MSPTSVPSPRLIDLFTVSDTLLVGVGRGANTAWITVNAVRGVLPTLNHGLNYSECRNTLNRYKSFKDSKNTCIEIISWNYGDQNQPITSVY